MQVEHGEACTFPRLVGSLENGISKVLHTSGKLNMAEPAQSSAFWPIYSLPKQHFEGSAYLRKLNMAEPAGSAPVVHWQPLTTTFWRFCIPQVS